MRRISSNIQHNDSNNALRNQEFRLQNVNNKIQSQNKIQMLRDDPLAAGHAVRYQSFLARLERFEKNTQTLNDQYRITESHMTSSLEILQRLRELSIQAAHGTYSADDLKKMAPEVDELLKELVQNGNAVGADGVRIFSGTKSFTEPFEVVLGNVPGGLGELVIEEVRYNGALDSKNIEIDERSFSPADTAGNKVFWAERQTLFSETDARDFIVVEDTSIEIDGVKIALTAGDNVYALISKINDSGVALKAYLDPVTNGLNLETTDSHQIWLRDNDENSVLTTLGLVKADQRPPYNLANSVRVSGGSIFDAVISMRNALLSGDQESLGGKILGGLDAGIDNLTSRISQTGARYERGETVLARLGTQNLNVTNALAREADLDITEAITDLRRYENTHQASLSVLGRIYKDTLLNYLP